MLVEFLTHEQASAYGRFVGAPSHAEMERYFFLDDADRALVEKRRGEANRLGFGPSSGPSARWAPSSPNPSMSRPRRSTMSPASWMSTTRPA